MKFADDIKNKDSYWVGLREDDTKKIREASMAQKENGRRDSEGPSRKRNGSEVEGTPVPKRKKSSAVIESEDEEESEKSVEVLSKITPKKNLQFEIEVPHKVAEKEVPGKGTDKEVPEKENQGAEPKGKDNEEDEEEGGSSEESSDTEDSDEERNDEHEYAEVDDEMILEERDDKIRKLEEKIEELEDQKIVDEIKRSDKKTISTQTEVREEVKKGSEVEVEGLPDPKTLKEKMVKDKGTAKFNKAFKEFEDKVYDLVNDLEGKALNAFDRKKVEMIVEKLGDL